MFNGNIAIKIFCLAMILMQLIGWILYYSSFLKSSSITYITFYSLVMLVGWIGILFLMNWARLLIIVISVLRIFYSVFQLTFTFLGDHKISVIIIPKILTILFFLFIIWFLIKHPTKAQFLRVNKNNEKLRE